MSGYRERGNGQLIGGAVLIAVGLLFLLDRVWFFNIGRMFHYYWPSVLILIGVLQLAGGRRRSWVGPLVLIVIGIVFQLERLNVFHWRMRNLWPLILVGIGFALLADRLRHIAQPPSSAVPPPPPGGPSTPDQPQIQT